MTSTVAVDAQIQQVTEVNVVVGNVEESAAPASRSHRKAYVGTISILSGALSVAMTVFGILDYNVCPGHTKLAIYMIVQGSTSIVIPILAMCWCFKLIRGTFIIVPCVIIGLFNLGWGIVGTMWLIQSSCLGTPQHHHALGFTIPVWIIGMVLCRCSKEDEDDDD